jgi:hypothetical protein
MPCPYFMPEHPTSIAALPHPERLPLGDAFAGRCTAVDVVPSEAMLHDCNLGYADCAHLPAERVSDAVRFAIRRDPKGLLHIHYVCEAAHAPVSTGVLSFDMAASQWHAVHEDTRIQRMAQCCVESHSKER